MRPLALALLLSTAAFAESGDVRSSVVFPPQQAPLTFSHAVHLQNGADCLTCHDRARKSERSSDLNLPGHAECETCHDLEAASHGKKTDPPSACSVCHPHFDPTAQREPARIDFPAPNLKFNHRVHVERKINCVTCHGSMSDVGLATTQQLPKMARCLTCHDDHVAPAACATCHPAAPSGRLQLEFSSGLLRPRAGNPLGIDHGPRFEFTHAQRAALSRSTCDNCHAQSFCQRCHDGLQKPLSVHPNDYITLHPVQARADSPHCTSCHRLQSFCAACHERAGVGFNAAPQLLARNVKVHPDRNTWVVTLGPNHHGVAASRDLQSCMSCHRQETCLNCHSDRDRFGVQGQISPHPNGFARICKRLAAANDRACLTCHSERTLAGFGCR